MLKKSLIIMVLSVLLTTLAVDAFCSDAVVVYDKDSATYYILRSGENYSIVKRNCIAQLQEDDEITGDLESQGTKEAFNVTRQQKISVTVKYVGLTRREAVKKYYELCGL